MRTDSGAHRAATTAEELGATRASRGALSALSGLALSVVNGILAIVVTRQVIHHYGSDFNGVNATANQFITILMLLEGGFTLATNVALFKPLAAGDNARVNAIMSATNKTFSKLGALTLAMGLVGSLGYALLVNSAVPYWVIAATMVMTTISTAFTLGVATKYQVLLQNQQREYVISNARIVLAVVTQGAILVGIVLDVHMLWVRALTMLGAIAHGLVVAWWARRTDPWLDFSVPPDGSSVTGTRDVLAQKLTGAVYTAAPMMVMSATVGAIAASVYVVYDQAATFLKGLLYAVANGPRMGVGQVAAEDDAARTKRVFLSYEAFVTQATLVLGATAFPLLVPFARLYAGGVRDAHYVDWVLGALVACVLVLELLHIPSGHLINLTGRFRVARNIQWAALVVLVVSLAVGLALAGFHGIVAAIAIAGLALCMLEIGYAHTRVVPHALLDYARLGVVPLVVFAALSAAEARWYPTITSWLGFIVAGVVLSLLNGLASFAVGFLCHRRAYTEIWARLLRLVRR